MVDSIVGRVGARVTVVVAVLVYLIVAVCGEYLPRQRRTALSAAIDRAMLEIHTTRYSNDWAVEISGGVQVADDLAERYGFINNGQIGQLNGMFHFQLAVVNASTTAADGHQLTRRSIGPLVEIGQRPDLSTALEREEAVSFVQQQQIKERMKRDYTTPSDPYWRTQWALLNTGQTSGAAGKDLNVQPAWMQGVNGSGVVVGFVDDGLEKRHPDLSANYDSQASWDFVHHDSDPTPDKYTGDEPDSHGTECAGEVGMVKDNGNCGVGVAYKAKIGGLKLNLARNTDLIEASALGYHNNHIHVYSNSWGPNDFGFKVDGPGSLTRSTLRSGATSGRNGRGVVYVWAAGNGGTYYDSCAADGYSSSIYTISVGSVDQSGAQADYDEQCSSKMAVTFSYNSRTFPGVDDSWDPYNQMRTTTLSGRCTDEFTGTSASTPLMSGVVALVLQANPLLTWRDVQYLVAYTSDRDSLLSGGWTTNGGGLRVSKKFGFGVINAEAMVSRAKRWSNVPSQHSHVIQPSHTSGTVRHYSPLTTTFHVTSSNSGGISFLEHVVLTVSLSVHGYSRGYDYSDFETELTWASSVEELYTWMENPHPRRGDIKIQLTSPHGTVSELLPYRNYDFINEEGYDSWPFMSVLHWGESPVGTWTLRVWFKSSSGYVSTSGLSMTIYGTTSTPVAVSGIPTHCHSSCAGGCSGPTDNDCDVCQHLRVASTLQCVTACPHGTHLYNNYCLGTPTHTTTTSHSPPTTEASVPPATSGASAPPATSGASAPPATSGASAPPATSGAIVSPATSGASAPSHTASSDHPTLSSSVSVTNGSSDPHVQHQTSHSSANTHLALAVGASVAGLLVLTSIATVTVVVVLCYLKRRKQRRGFSFVPLSMEVDDSPNVSAV